MTRLCADCGTDDPGRNGWCRMLCTACYKRNHHAATLDRFPTINRRMAAAPCTRCGVPTKRDDGECKDCKGIEKRIKDAEPLDGEWVRSNLVMRHRAA